MSKKLRVLIVEDSEDDAELILRELRSGGYEPLSERVDTNKAMADALKKKTWDVITIDYSMPHFNGLEALKLLRSSALDIPCIIVSGKIGEDTAVQLMKAGANDYVMKGNLKRLASAIERELDDAEVRRERKRAEESLRISERAITSSINAIALADLKGNLTYVNPAFLEMWGFSKNEEVLGEPSVNFWQMQEKANAIIEALRSSGKWRGELIARRKDGSCFDVQLSGNMVIDEKGNPIYMFGAFIDITERKQAEEAIKESEERYRTLFEASAEGILIADLETRQFQYANPAICRMLGYTEEALRTMDVAAIHPKGDLQRVLAEFEAQARGDKILAPELPCLRKDGTIFYADVNAVGITIGGRRFNSGFFRDITERKLSEEKLLKSYESMKKTLNDAISTMVKIVEMRDPYTAGHQQKVADLAIAIAGEMKLEDARIDNLRMAAVVHDVGKMYVPSDILSKPGKLSDMELSLIRTHSQAGFDVVKGMDLPCNVAKTVLQHHERLDGSGYPNQLKSEDTLMEAKILAVADVVEAMASHRPYRPALGIDKALEEISNGRGKLYDPAVVDACLKLFQKEGFQFTEPGLQDVF